LSLVSTAGLASAALGDLPAQGLLALALGVAGSLGQPSFAAAAQRHVPLPEQGRAFVRVATRQQLVWVLGALVPVVVAFPLVVGDLVVGATGGVGALGHLVSCRRLPRRVVPRPPRLDRAA